MNYGKAIRFVRSSRNLSQKQLAKLARLDPSYVSLIEKNQRTPSIRALQRITKALRVPLHLLTLLASEREDLTNISTEQATELGRQLLGILLDAESEVES